MALRVGGVHSIKSGAHYVFEQWNRGPSFSKFATKLPSAVADPIT
jgi:hypothetical protein